ncbi:hypothetical protein [Photobacterium indicum]|jgi:hypothetical protein|nr:hypothetical protein [Photobacterium indicum]
MMINPKTKIKSRYIHSHQQKNHDDIRGLIICKACKKTWQHHLRDAAIAIVTWGGWFFLIFQPFIKTNYDSANGLDFIHSISLENCAIIFVTLFCAIMITYHLWVRYHVLIWQWEKLWEHNKQLSINAKSIIAKKYMRSISINLEKVKSPKPVSILSREDEEKTYGLTHNVHSHIVEKKNPEYEERSS